jgi:hypothetical protein
MSTPIILISGAAGSGKDTVANFIAKYSGSVCIAQADPMKRFAKTVFGFTEDQLWGPSESRNAPDPRFDDSETWERATRKIVDFGQIWICDVLPDLDGIGVTAARSALHDWFTTARRERGGQGRPPLTPRYVLQTLGTEWGRHFNPSMWNDYAVRSARTLLGGGYGYDKAEGLFKTDAVATGLSGDAEFVIITDGRFRNELMGIKAVGGSCIKVQNPTPADNAVERAGVAGHRSESEQKQIPDSYYDFIVTNDKKQGLLALENLAAKLVQNLRGKPVALSTGFVP